MSYRFSPIEAGIIDLQMHAVAELVLQRGAKQMRISLRNIVLDIAELGRRKRDGSVGSSQWPRISGAGGNAAPPHV